jgi:hypothetical protein
MIIQDYAVTHHYVALCVSGDIGFVRHHDDGNLALIKLLKNRHDLDAGPAVQIAGRLVREQHFRLINQCARDCHALLLAA